MDGRVSDWTGALPGFGGAQFYSRGELVYEDHIFDAYGAFGIPMGPFTYSTHYGDLEHQDQADLSQVRVGTDASSNLWLLARATTMNDAKPATALLVLLDTKPGSTSRDVGFGSGLTSSRADVALYLFGDGGLARDLAAGKPNAAGRGFDNIANVASRTNEPSRDWWEQEQALAPQARSIDDFFATACFQSANDGRPRDEWTTPLLENLRWVPYVNYQGAPDELGCRCSSTSTVRSG